MVNSQNSQDEQKAIRRTDRHAGAKIRLGTLSFSGGTGRIQQSDGVGAVPFAEDCEECQQFKGRMKDTCLGVGLNGRKKPPAASVKAFREEHGIKPCTTAVVESHRVSTAGVITRQPTATQPHGQPGTELKRIFESLKITIPGCFTCGSVGARMNTLGVEGCRKERDDIVSGIKERAKSVDWATWRTAAWESVKNGLAFKINPFDPIPGLFDEALRRTASVPDSRTEHQKAYAALVPYVPHSPRPSASDELVPIPAMFRGTPKRNLIYHIYPHKRTDNWKWNIRQLVARIDLFDGVRSIGVALDANTATLDEVKAEFSGVRIDHWIDVPNAPMLGEPGYPITDDGGNALLVEGQTFLPLLLTLPRHDDSVTFFAHAKGMRYQRKHAALRWASLMYRGCLDDWKAVQAALQKFPFAGCFKRYHDFDKLRNWHWHFSGTFLWFRNRDVFQSPQWSRLHPNWHGQVEAWPANLFPAENAFCLFGDDCGNLYRVSEVEKWEKEMPVSDLTFFRQEQIRGLTGKHWNALLVIHRRLADRIKELGLNTVAELGPGLGPFLIGAQNAGLNATGYDRNPYARDFAVDNGVEPDRYRLADFRSVTLNPVDAIVSVEVFEHISDDDLHHICSQIADNCKLFYFTSTPYADWFDGEWGHINRKSKAEWIEFFRQYGLTYQQDDATVEPWGMIFKGRL